LIRAGKLSVLINALPLFEVARIRGLTSQTSAANTNVNTQVKA